MGLGDSDILDDGDGGKSVSSVSCSICLEVVTDNGDRSWAKLQCGHQFHLDCIGSAINIKGAMQCPNCRKIEKGQWLYASGCRAFPEFSMEDWAHDEDLYDLGYSEMSFGVHWCPFSGLTRLPSSFDDGDFSSTPYHDLLGRAIFSEHTAVPSATHPCPYIAYFGPIHPSSSNPTGSVSDSTNFNSHWNGPSIPGEIPTSYTFPALDLHYHSWEHHSTPFSTTTGRVGGGADQASVPSISQRSSRANSDIPRSASVMHPFLVGHSAGARAGSSVASSMIPPYPGSNARARDRVQALQAYYQQQQPSNSLGVRAPVVSGTRRSGHRGLPQVGQMASSSEQTGGFYFFPPGTSSRSFQEGDNHLPTRYHGWERDHLPAHPFNVIDRDSNWGSFHQPNGGSESGTRPGGYRQRHGSERTPSQNRS